MYGMYLPTSTIKFKPKVGNNFPYMDAMGWESHKLPLENLPLVGFRK